MVYFLDMLWERTRSRRLLLLVVTAWLKSFLVLLLLIKYGQPVACRGYADNIGVQFGIYLGMGGLNILYLAIAGAAAASQNSLRYLPAALLIGLGHFIAFVITQLVPCSSWMHAASVDPSRALEDGFTPIWGSTVSLLNLLLLSLMLAELGRLSWVHRDGIRAGLHTAGHERRDARIDDVYLFPRLCRAICIAPVRHNASMLISAVAVMTATVAICVVAQRARAFIDGVLSSMRSDDSLQTRRRLSKQPIRSSRPSGIDYFAPGYCTDAGLTILQVADVSDAPTLSDCAQAAASAYLSGISDGYLLFSCSSDYTNAYVYTDHPVVGDEALLYCDTSPDSTVNTYTMDVSIFSSPEDDNDDGENLESFAIDQLVSYYTRQMSQEDVIQWTEVLFDSVLDGITTAAAFTLFSLLISFWVSYELLLRDHNKIVGHTWSSQTSNEFHKRAPAESTYTPPPVVEADGLLEGDDADLYLSAPLLSGNETDAPPEGRAVREASALPYPSLPLPTEEAGLPSPQPRVPAFMSTGRLTDGTLDIEGNFQFLNAGAYPVQVLMAVGFSYIGLLLSFSVLIGLLRYPPTRWHYGWILLASPIGKVLMRLVQRYCLGLCVVRDNWIRAPRTLALLDLINAFANPFLILTGVSSAISRFALGVIGVMFRTVIFQRPLLPATLSAFDSGTGAYGAVMKCRYAHLLDTTDARSKHGGAMWEPGALSGGLAV